MGEVENLLNLLYSGTCRHTDDLTLMLNILKINKRHLISEKPTWEVQSDVKVETHEVFEDEDSYFHGGFDDVEPTSDMTGYKESDQSSEDNWKPNGESVEEQKGVVRKKKKGRPKKEALEDGGNDGWLPIIKQAKSIDTEDDWRPKKNKGGRPKKIKSGEEICNSLENKKSKKAVSDEEEDCSDYADSKQEIGSKEFKFQKEDKIFDKTVNTEVLVNEVNMNPMLTLNQIEAKEVPIFHYSCEHCNETFQNIIKYSKHMHGAHVDNIHTFNDKYRPMSALDAAKDSSLSVAGPSTCRRSTKKH